MELVPPSPEPAPVAEEAAPRDAERSEGLAIHFRNLTLNPAALRPSLPRAGSPKPRDQRERDPRRSSGLRLATPPVRRRGVRTVLSVRRERMARMMTNARRLAQFLKNANQSGDKDEPKSMPFKCLCSFCVLHAWDPSENAKIGSDYNTELS